MNSPILILVLRGDQDALPYFDKDAVRIPYDDETIRTYLQDKRYKDREADPTPATGHIVVRVCR